MAAPVNFLHARLVNGTPISRSDRPELPVAASDSGTAELVRAKAALRAAARARRAALSVAAETGGYEAAARHFFDRVPRAPGCAIALYWPLPTEFDTRPLLARLDAAGHACALPVTPAPGTPLTFRAWRPGMVLTPGRHNIAEPGADAPPLTPDIVVMPALAFDRRGGRLGYGGGYYDRTLAALRAGPRPVVAVLLAFAGQEVAQIPAGPEDERVDWIVTEQFAIRIGEAGGAA